MSRLFLNHLILEKNTPSRHIEIVRVLSQILVPASLLLSLVYLLGGHFAKVGIGFLTALIFSIPLLLLKKQRFLAAKWAFFSQFLILSFSLPFVLGTDAHTEWIVILTPSLAFLLFKWRSHLLYLAFGLVGYLLIIGIYYFHKPLLVSDHPQIYRFGLAAIICTFLYWLMIVFRRETERSEAIISQQNADLRTAQTELETRNAALISLNQELQQFAHRASHDMKEPLRTISSFSTLLSRKLADQPDKQELLAFVVDGSRRMSLMLDDLLNYAKAGAENAPTEPVDLAEIVENVRRSFRLQLEETGGQISSGPLPTVMGHATLMTQLFQNLIGNGLKYSRKGTNPVIKIDCSKENSSLRLVFEDNGIGIESQFLQKIFEPFLRLHGRAEFEGSGIGLATCRKIVDVYGGKIWAESEPVIGSRIFVEWPVSMLVSH